MPTIRKLKSSTNHLQSQTRKNLAKAILCLVLLGVAFLPLIPRLLILNIDFLVETSLLVSLASLIGFYYYLGKFRAYNAGLEGEKRVARLLGSALNDDYYLMSSVYIHDGFGDIDHVLLGPNGVFVIEVKNWSGRITCHGDEWQRENRHGKRESSSPSKQAKKNAIRVKSAIESSGSRGVWVEGIVVFTNPNSDLQVNHAAVPVLRLPELPNFIASYRSHSRYTRPQLEQIGKAILKKARK
ncbi:MAG: nuclease-related domain-containing protein [Candidatus Bathyarchaeia archaeon]